MLSQEGRCKFGDARADGFVRSDAVGVVILKPLSDALADGDRIRAVIRGSAIGSDGHDGGLLVRPTVSGQSRVLEQAYQDADISPSEVDFVEAHGTGTQIGDPVELEALAAVLGPGRAQERRLLVTSATARRRQDSSVSSRRCCASSTTSFPGVSTSTSPIRRSLGTNCR